MCNCLKEVTPPLAGVISAAVIFNLVKNALTSTGYENSAVTFSLAAAAAGAGARAVSSGLSFFTDKICTCGQSSQQKTQSRPVPTRKEPSCNGEDFSQAHDPEQGLKLPGKTVIKEEMNQKWFFANKLILTASFAIVAGALQPLIDQSQFIIKLLGIPDLGLFNPTGMIFASIAMATVWVYTETECIAKKNIHRNIIEFFNALFLGLVATLAIQQFYLTENLYQITAIKTLPTLISMITAGYLTNKFPTETVKTLKFTIPTIAGIAVASIVFHFSVIAFSATKLVRPNQNSISGAFAGASTQLIVNFAKTLFPERQLHTPSEKRWRGALAVALTASYALFATALEPFLQMESFLGLFSPAGMIFSGSGFLLSFAHRKLPCVDRQKLMGIQIYFCTYLLADIGGSILAQQAYYGFGKPSSVDPYFAFFLTYVVPCTATFFASYLLTRIVQRIKVSACGIEEDEDKQTYTCLCCPTINTYHPPADSPRERLLAEDGKRAYAPPPYHATADARAIGQTPRVSPRGEPNATPTAQAMLGHA